MYLSLSRGLAPLGSALALVLGLGLPAAAAAQGAAPRANPGQGDSSSPIVSSEISLSRNEAELTLELRDGRKTEFALRDGVVIADGKNVGQFRRGDALDSSWRRLLSDAMEGATANLATLLVDWQSPVPGAGTRLDSALETMLASVQPGAPQAPGTPLPPPAPMSSTDTVSRLLERIAELEARAESAVSDEDAEDFSAMAESIREQVEREVRKEAVADGAWWSPLRHVGRGIVGLLSTLASMAVLVGLGFVAVFFGRRYLEGVADTARHATLRSGLVGVAASFLIIPVYILGMIALAISIVGIPVLLAWIPLFPVAVVLACAFGYLAVAHAGGEALAERRFTGGDWFRHANSYYYVLTGTALLWALFIGAQIVQIGGPWFQFIHHLLAFLGVVVTFAAFSIGLGAVLISRGGTRPLGPGGVASADYTGVFEEEAHV